MTGMDTFTRRLRARIEHLKMSQAKVAELTGFQQSTVKKLLDGTTSNLPQPGRFLALCRALGVTPAQLLGFEPWPGDPADPPDPREAVVEVALAGLDGLDEKQLRFAAELLDLVYQHRAAFARG